MGDILTKLATKKKAPKTVVPNDGSWSVSGGSEVKIVVCGGGGVGKSALTIQMVSNHFIEEYDPTIEDSYRKQQMVDGEIAMLDILDTAGQEEFSAMRGQWFRQGDAFLLVYSITDRKTFDEIRKIFESILKAKDATKAGPSILVGNKCDLTDSRQVTQQEGKDLASSLGVPFMEASAKQRVNVEECFVSLVKQTRAAGCGGAGGKK